MEKKGKVTKLLRIEDLMFYLSPRNSVLSRGMPEWVGEVQIIKINLPPKSPVRPDISGLLAGFQWGLPDMSGPWPGHIRPIPIPKRLSPGTGQVRFPSRVPVRLAGHVRPLTRTCPGLWHPNGQIPFGGYKREPTPPLYIWSLISTCKPFWGTLLSSQPLFQAPFKSKLLRRDLSLTLE